MTGAELLRYVIVALDGSNIRYALAGSIASMAYGEPRTTLDLDIVVALSPADIDHLRSLFPRPEFYLDESQARKIAAEGGQFNVIHPASGWKIDFFVPSDDVERAQLERRRRRLVLPDLEAAFSPPEELIVKKLMYYQKGGSDKHLRDIAVMLSVSADEIDLAHVDRLASEHDLTELWIELQGRARG